MIDFPKMPRAMSVCVGLVAATVAGWTALAPPASAQALLQDPGTTLEELRARSGEVFRSLSGPDRVLTREEFLTAPLGESVAPGDDRDTLLSRLFDRLDEDGDGVVTRAQWEERLASDVSVADENEDGRITLRELANARRNLSTLDALGMIF